MRHRRELTAFKAHFVPFFTGGRDFLRSVDILIAFWTYGREGDHQHRFERGSPCSLTFDHFGWLERHVDGREGIEREI